MFTLRFICTLLVTCTLLVGLLAATEPAGRIANDPEPQAPGRPIDTGVSAVAIDPRSDTLLKRMSDYLTGLSAFSVRATNTMQVMLVTGEKLDFEAVSDVTVRRPDRVRTRRAGVAGSGDFFYNGRTVTVFDRSTQFFTVSEAPPTIDGMLERLQDLLGVVVPGADLLYTDIYQGLIADVTHAHHVAIEDIAGTRTHHLAFRGQEVDWQIWIEDGDRPLPRRYVITTKWMTGAPQFGVVLTDWNLSPQLDDKTFVFEAPAGSRKVEALKPDIPPLNR